MQEDRTFDPQKLLEQRNLLAAVSWDGGGDGSSWMDRLNWSTDQLPSGEDDVTLDVAGDVLVTVSGAPPTVASITNRETIIVSGSTANGHALLSAGAFVNEGVVRLESLNTTRQSNLSASVAFANLAIVICFCQAPSATPACC